MKHRSDIQGLRALAIIPVLLYHADSRLLGGGFIGVDVFFVISGFLITGIIAGELDGRRFSIAGFYRRRVRRLFPALYAMLAFSFACALWLLPPADLSEFARTALAVVFFVSNVEFARLSDYFQTAAEMKPLLHTWSLAVEEQFYIVFPPLLMLMWLRFRRWVTPVLAGAALLSLLLAWLITRTSYDMLAFYLAPARAFELIIGALLALAPIPPLRRQWTRDVLSWTGVALIVGSAVLFHRRSELPWYAIPPCLGSALIIYAGQGGVSSAGRFLSIPVLTFIGTLSYSLYLWHWPFLTFGRFYFLGEMTPLQTWSLLGASIMAAIICWRFVEKPFLDKRAAPKGVLRAGLAPMAVCSLAALTVLAADGLPNRYPEQIRRLYAGADDFNPKRDACHSGNFEQIPYAETCVYGAPSAAPSVVVWGDSHGAELVAAIGKRMTPMGSAVRQVTASSCPPAVGYDRHQRPYCRKHNKAVLDALIADRDVHTVVLVAYLSSYYPDVETPVGWAYEETVRALSAADKRVVLVYPIPIMPGEPPQMLGLRAARGVDPESYGMPWADYLEQNRGAIALLDHIAVRTGVDTLHPERVLCDARLCRAYAPEAGVLYFNQTHLSLTGADLVTAGIPAEWLSPQASVSSPAGAER